MASGSATSYADCVSSLRTSLKYLESSVETLDQGVADFPRLSNVLKTVRVCPQDPTASKWPIIQSQELICL